MNALDIVLVVQAVLLVLLAIMLQQLILLKRQFTRVVKEVTAYVSYITREEEVADDAESAPDTNRIKRPATSVTPESKDGAYGITGGMKSTQSVPSEREEMDSGIIQAVLSQYFP